MRYRVVIEQAGGNYSAYVPDLPGCIAAGATLDAVRRAIREAIDVHVAGLRADGETVPSPTITAHEPEPADPFVAFIEWAAEPDQAAYANL